MSLRVRTRAVVALAAVVAFVVVDLALVHTALGQRIDDLSAEAAAALKVWTTDTIPWRLLKGGVFVVLLGSPVVAAGWGWRRGRRRAVVVGLAVIAVSFGVGQILKEVLPRPDLMTRVTPLPFNTLPSGHTIAAAATVVAFVLVADPHVRSRVRVLGALYAGAVGGFVLLTASHRLSDVLAAFALVTTVTAIATVFVPVEPPSATEPFATVALASVGVGGAAIAVVAFARLVIEVGTDDAVRSEQFTGLVAAIVASFAAACLLVAALAPALTVEAATATGSRTPP